jgi:L-threonylcarbamoyladenylate synthase
MLFSSEVNITQEEETEVIVVDPASFTQQDIQPAIDLIRSGELVAFPTETVYGLGANGLSGEACRKIFQAKGRPSDNPLIVHISSIEMLHMVAASVPARAEALMNAFWPGPLTLLFPKKECVPDVVTAGLETVAVRMPAHPVARKLIEFSGVPIAAPSANRSGRPSPTTAAHVLTDLNRRVKCIIDGGSASFGVESTVVDVSRSPPVILRPGGVTREQLKRFLPDVIVFGERPNNNNKKKNNNNNNKFSKKTKK